MAYSVVYTAKVNCSQQVYFKFLANTNLLSASSDPVPAGAPKAATMQMESRRWQEIKFIADDLL